MDFKQVLIVTFIVIIALIVPGLMILSLKSDSEFLKGQVSTLQKFIDVQDQQFYDLDKYTFKNDSLFDVRIDVLEQKMRKVYQGYEIKQFHHVDSLYMPFRFSERRVIVHDKDGNEVVLVLPEIPIIVN